jgi:hypothetical protein
MFGECVASTIRAVRRRDRFTTNAKSTARKGEPGELRSTTGDSVNTIRHPVVKGSLLKVENCPQPILSGFRMGVVFKVWFVPPLAERPGETAGANHRDDAMAAV